MDYTAIRTSLRSGDLLLCAGTSWFSRLIQAATGSEWSHVGLILRLEQLDRVMLLESVESVGVRAVPLSRYFSNYQQSGAAYPGKLAIYRHRDFPGEAQAGSAWNRLGHFAVDRLGWPYDGQQIAELAARLTLHHLAPESPSPELSSDSLENQAYICSEYVAACYAQLGLKISPGTCPYVTPGDFVDDMNLVKLSF